MNRGQELQNRRRFVEDGIGAVMAVKPDFEFIKYASRSIDDREFMRIGDVMGRAVTLDITAKSLEEIFEDISRINLIGKENVNLPSCIITDQQELRKISLLFK